MVSRCTLSVLMLLQLSVIKSRMKYSYIICLMLRALSLGMWRYDMLLLQKCDEVPHSSPSYWRYFLKRQNVKTFTKILRVLSVDPVECLVLVCVCVCDARAHDNLWIVILIVSHLAMSMFCCSLCDMHCVYPMDQQKEHIIL